MPVPKRSMTNSGPDVGLEIFPPCNQSRTDSHMILISVFPRHSHESLQQMRVNAGTLLPRSSNHLIATVRIIMIEGADVVTRQKQH